MPLDGLLMVATGTGAATLTENTQVVISLVTSVLSLFEVYPLNIVLTFALGGYAFKFFGKGRKAAGGK